MYKINNTQLDIRTKINEEIDEVKVQSSKKGIIHDSLKGKGNNGNKREKEKRKLNWVTIDGYNSSEEVIEVEAENIISDRDNEVSGIFIDKVK